MRESSSFFTKRAADVTSEPFSLAMSGDRNEGPKHDRSRSDTNVISMNFYIYANLAMFFIFPVLFCSVIFLFEHETIHTIRVLNVFDSCFRT